jgi:hypothetical protein
VKTFCFCRFAFVLLTVFFFNILLHIFSQVSLSLLWRRRDTFAKEEVKSFLVSFETMCLAPDKASFLNSHCSLVTGEIQNRGEGVLCKYDFWQVLKTLQNWRVED